MSEMSINGKPRSWFGANAQLAIDTIAMKPTKGIPSCQTHIMDIPIIEELAGVQPGDYKKDPTAVYLQMQKNNGTNFIDQFIPDNPLTMGQHGYESGGKTATTGMQKIVLNGMLIDSPEAVVGHMEKFEFSWMERYPKEHPEGDTKEQLARSVDAAHKTQDLFGPNLLKVPYGEFNRFPRLRYTQYGYENYFMAYALYPEVMERDFKLQGDVCERVNRSLVKLLEMGGFSPLVRLDHDMADSRGTLVDVETLDRIWFPHFARSIKPLIDAGIRPIWHCDGNLMQMVPRLIESGLGGFQGFQYEDGMDYEKICKMTDRNGGPLMIWAGCSVTTTLPHGTRQDVVNQVKWLVEKGPKVGLVLTASSSIAPGTPIENVKMLIAMQKHYRENGR